MSLLKELKERGIISNITNDEKAEAFFENKDKAMYIGFDPTAPSLHLGNYVMVSMLKRFADYGIKTFAVLGGATGVIGDPSGKSAERNLLDLPTIKKNVSCIKKQLTKFGSPTFFNNAEIYKNMNVLDFLRNVGKSINVKHILEREIVKKRLDVGISYTEFSYSIIQGYDFYHLYKNFNVSLQMGGSDQWGNITAGVDYIRKMTDEKNTACGITINLLTKSDGAKFGKSEKGAIFLDKNLTSPYVMYQFLLNQADADVEKLLMFFSFKKVEEIKSLLEEHKKNPHLKGAQKELARELLISIHGETEYEKSVKISKHLFESAYEKLTLNNWAEVTGGMECFFSEKRELNIVDFLVDNGVVTSKRIARELISTKSISVNNILVDSDSFQVKATEAYFNKYSVVKKGKKNFFILEWKLEE